ncbi:MAG TPA: ferredoxin-thioredoxin reductase catalytic domain-containing protein [Candidatus Nanoarchaeia archaeon]|nr:ferredoxin-thioredoxin reductase catalytic domain-containing protein [Candidatus Nanoarchaeia archaeon]
MGNKEISQLNISTQIRQWEEWVSRQPKDNNSFILNINKENARSLAEGVLNNEKNQGLKYCPCRITTGDYEEDLRLICPCNFKIQKVWKEKGECWCSLFVKPGKK